jgi:hypothetical protein
MSSHLNNTDSHEEKQPVRLENVEAVNALRERIAQLHTPILVEFCARGTRFSLCFIPVRQLIIIGHPDTGGSNYTFVGLFSDSGMGGFYPFDLTMYCSAGYIMEKLRIRNEVDASNIARLLNALGGHIDHHHDIQEV